MSVVAAPPGSDLEQLLGLICSIFEVPLAMVSYPGSSRVHVMLFEPSIGESMQMQMQMQTREEGSGGGGDALMASPSMEWQVRVRSYKCLAAGSTCGSSCAAPIAALQRTLIESGSNSQSASQCVEDACAPPGANAGACAHW